MAIFRKDTLPLMLVASSVFLHGCGLTNIKASQFSKFRINPMQTIVIDDAKIHSKIKPYIQIKHNDHNALSCRMSGQIYLPYNFKLSDYIKNVIERSLYLSDLLASPTATQYKQLNLNFDEITVNNITGNWKTKCNIYINHVFITTINITTEFNSQFNAEETCNNAANSFDNFVVKLANIIFTDPKVLAALG